MSFAARGYRTVDTDYGDCYETVPRDQPVGVESAEDAADPLPEGDGEGEGEWEAVEPVGDGLAVGEVAGGADDDGFGVRDGGLGADDDDVGAGALDEREPVGLLDGAEAGRAACDGRPDEP